MATGVWQSSLSEPHHSSRRPYSLLHTVADSQVRQGCQVLKNVFERVKMEVVATFPCAMLLTMTWGKAGIGRLLGKVTLLKQMCSWQQRSYLKSKAEAPWIGYPSHCSAHLRQEWEWI